MGLLSGLSKLGLGGLDKDNLFEEPQKQEIPVENEKPEEQPKPEKEEKPEIKEEDLLLKKTCKCPVCDTTFKSLTVKANRARLVSTDRDLRPRYKDIEPLKYDVILCPNCGCASLARNWGSVTDKQRHVIRDEISAKYKKDTKEYDVYTYDEAFRRYQMALANAMVRQAKSSEKAYICLKTAWLLRCKAESLDESAENYSEEYEETMKMENEFMENALEGLLKARASETPPVFGMDENTLDYLIASLSVRYGKYEDAARLVYKLLQSNVISSRMKEKTLELKDEILRARSK